MMNSIEDQIVKNLFVVFVENMNFDWLAEKIMNSRSQMMMLD